MERASHLGSLRLSRRQFAIGSSLATVAGAKLALPHIGRDAVAKQTDLASAGYPTIDVTVTVSGFEGLPETLEAGRYLVNLTAAEDVEFIGALAFVRPFEMSAADFLDFLGAMAGPPPEASPEAAPEGEEGGGENFLVPAFIYQSSFAGGASAMAGGTGMAVIDLTEGEWVAWGDDPTASQAPAIVTVTGEFPADGVDPEAAVTITLVDFGIMVEGALTAGEHIVKIDNQGAQPHFVDFEMLPAGTTNDQIAAMLAAPPPDPSATPEAGALNPETDFVPVTFTATQSIDVQMWTTITLEPGTLGLLCWFPTAGVGDPHAFHGMHTVAEVTA